MECTFRVKDLLKLIHDNPHVKNIIVKVDKEGRHPFTARPQKDKHEDADEIIGCPYPPGCGDE